MENLAKINLGIIAVSRDCFPIELSQKRRTNVVAECKKKNISITELQTTIENENDSRVPYECRLGRARLPNNRYAPWNWR